MLPEVTDPETYGPPLNDYDEIVDPTTELSAAKLEALAVDVSAMTYVVPRGWVRVSSGSSPTIVSHSGVWGGTEALKPTLTRLGTGHYYIVFASQYYDINPTVSRRVQRYLNIRAASVTVFHSALDSFRVGQVYAMTSNSVEVVTMNSSQAPTDTEFMLWVY